MNQAANSYTAEELAEAMFYLAGTYGPDTKLPMDVREKVAAAAAFIKRQCGPNVPWPDHDQAPCETMAQCHAYAQRCIDQGWNEALSAAADALWDDTYESVSTSAQRNAIIQLIRLPATGNEQEKS